MRAAAQAIDRAEGRTMTINIGTYLAGDNSEAKTDPVPDLNE